MRTIYILARMTVLEAVRSRFLYALILFVAGVMLASRFVACLSLTEQAKILKDAGLGLFSLFTCILAIVLPIEHMQKEREHNALASVLTKPLSRYQFMMGKYAGVCVTMSVAMAAMAVLIAGLMTWYRVTWDGNMIKAFVLVFCQGLVLISCSMLVSVVIPGYFIAVLCGFSIYLAGNLLEPLKEWVGHADSLASEVLGLLLLYVMPHLENLNIQDAVALGETVAWSYVGENVLYSAAYAVVVFAIASIWFNQKDF